jgi:hypothetical protein
LSGIFPEGFPTRFACRNDKQEQAVKLSSSDLTRGLRVFST